jgi:hypothetical protein
MGPSRRSRCASPERSDWAEGVCALMRELRRVALKHPAAFQLLSRGPEAAPGPKPLSPRRTCDCRAADIMTAPTTHHV